MEKEYQEYSKLPSHQATTLRINTDSDQSKGNRLYLKPDAALLSLISQLPIEDLKNTSKKISEVVNTATVDSKNGELSKATEKTGGGINLFVGCHFNISYGEKKESPKSLQSNNDCFNYRRDSNQETNIKKNPDNNIIPPSKSSDISIKPPKPVNIHLKSPKVNETSITHKIIPEVKIHELLLKKREAIPTPSVKEEGPEKDSKSLYEFKYNEQITNIKLYWRNTNPAYPFAFKKQVMTYYKGTEEISVSEVFDLSKKSVVFSTPF